MPIGDQLLMIGGGAKSDFWRQIFADVLQISILKPSLPEEATSLGAAIIAGKGAGVFQTFDVLDRFMKIESCTDPIRPTVRCTINNAGIRRMLYRPGKDVFQTAYSNETRGNT